MHIFFFREKEGTAMSWPDDDSIRLNPEVLATEIFHFYINWK
jgi:hypothetical protein